MSQPTDTPARTEYIEGLRALANWLERHPDVQQPTGQQLLIPLSTNEAVEAFAAEHWLAVAYDAEGNASADIRFGPITFHAYGYVDFKQNLARANERNARRWAADNGMVIQPAPLLPKRVPGVALAELKPSTKPAVTPAVRESLTNAFARTDGRVSGNEMVAAALVSLGYAEHGGPYVYLTVEGRTAAAELEAAQVSS